MRKTKSPPFVMLRVDLLKNKQWRSLSSSAKVIYIYLRSKYNYKTLGRVTLSYSEMSDIISPEAMSRALKELQEQKFIEKTKKGGLFGGCCEYEFIGTFKAFL